MKFEVLQEQNNVLIKEIKALREENNKLHEKLNEINSNKG